MACSPVLPLTFSAIDSAVAAAALTRLLIQRVPFEAKVVLLAVEKAAELTAHHIWASTPRTSKGGDISDRRERSGETSVASLAELARAAAQSSLLPLPVPSSSPLWCSEDDGSQNQLSAETLLEAKRGGEKTPTAGARRADASEISVTAGLLLDAFTRSPAVAIRAIKRAELRR